MTRDLTPEERDRCLSQEQVDQLREGTFVYVKWSGGNGPHVYKIVRRHGFVYTAHRGGARDGEPQHALTCCGPDDGMTRVFLP